MNQNRRESANIAATDTLRTQAARLSVEISDEQATAMETFLAELKAYNEHTNLVSNAAVEVLIENHVLDALSLVPLINKLKQDSERPIKLVDIGSGAGFPAMILALMLENLRVLLIDSVGKKTRFLADVASKLGIDQRVEVQNCRAEELSLTGKYREQYDFATARAVGKLDLVCELTMPFVKVGGYLLAQKSRSQLSDELEDGRYAAELLGGNVEAIDALDKEVLQRDLVVVRVLKENKTPSRFPRPTAQLKKSLR